MKRYEYIVKNGISEMAIATAFCIATYLEGLSGKEMDCEFRREFIKSECEPIEKWLNEEIDDRSEVMVEHTVSEEKSEVVHKKKYPTCRECKWWTGKKSSVGRECMNPIKQEQWSRRKQTPTCHIKESGTKACKHFEKGDTKWN